MKNCNCTSCGTCARGSTSATQAANFQNDAWDEQIERDVEAGKLDALLAEVDGEIAAGLAKPL